MKYKFLYLLTIFTFFSLPLIGQNISFNVSIEYYKASKEEKVEIKRFSDILKNRLTEYNWKLPQNVLSENEQIVIYLSTTITKQKKNNYYQAFINCYGGISSSQKLTMPPMKDIFYREKENPIYIDYNEDPYIDTKNPDDIVNIFKFYTYLLLGKTFDRLSFVNSENFQLLGNSSYSKLNTILTLINSNESKENWIARLKIAEKYNNLQATYERRLEALFYNAKYFYNINEFDRCKLFVPYIITNLKESNIKETFLKKNRLNLLKIFILTNDSNSILSLKELDAPTENNTYNIYLKKLKSP